MKKVLSVVLALCLLAGLAAAAAAEEELTGAWYAKEMGDGETMTDISAYGMAIVLTLNEDGTASMDTGDGDVSEGTWTAEGAEVTVTIDGEPVTGSLADGELTLSGGGQVILFTREAPAAPEFAEPKTDAALEDYNGTYTCAYVKNGNACLPAEGAAQFGLTLPAFTIENGVVSIDSADTEDFGIGTMFGLFAGQTMELKDGQLAGVLTLGEDAGTTGITFTLLQDGMLYTVLLSDDEPMFELYYTPAE